MRKSIAGALCCVLSMGSARAEEQPVTMKIPAPEFKDVTEWLNTKPIKLAEARGKVVVVHFWAFG